MSEILMLAGVACLAVSASMARAETMGNLAWSVAAPL